MCSSLCGLSSRCFSDLGLRIWEGHTSRIAVPVIVRSFSLNPFDFQVYQEYCANYDSARDTVKQASSRPAVAEFLQEGQKRCDGKKLDTLLIQPVQRIPRYRLLFQDLLRKTPAGHPDHEVFMSSQSSLVNRCENDIFSVLRHFFRFALQYDLYRIVASYRTNCQHWRMVWTKGTELFVINLCMKTMFS